MELTKGRKTLIDTQASLGVRAGCQLWERFVSMVGGGEVSYGTAVSDNRTLQHTSALSSTKDGPSAP